MPSRLKPHRSYSYHVYGLRIESDSPVKELIPARFPSSAKAAEISVRFRTSGLVHSLGTRQDESLWYTSDIPDEQGNPLLKIWRGKHCGDYHIQYSHGLEFFLNREASSIRLVQFGRTDEFEVCEYLLGPVLGIAMRLRGVTCLHASAVAIGEEAILFVGPAGAGKSTTAGLFVKQGHAALADDIVPVRERGGLFEALPGYPRLNLWPESVKALHGRRRRKQEARPEVNKQQWVLDAKGREFRGDALPIRAIYMFGERCGGAKAPRVQEMTPQEALVGLIANTYANKIPDDATRASEFELLGRMTNRLRPRRIIPHRGLARLGELHEVIRRDLVTARRKRAAAASR